MGSENNLSKTKTLNSITMKKKVRTFRLLTWVMALCISMTFYSCTSYHFANPLPVDSKNIYKTPKKFRGLITENSDSSEGYWLKKHSITVKEVRSHKIINGIWFNPRDTMRNLNLGPRWTSLIPSRWAPAIPTTKKTATTFCGGLSPVCD